MKKTFIPTEMVVEYLKEPGKKNSVNKTQYKSLVLLEGQGFIAESKILFFEGVKEKLILMPHIRKNYLIS